MSKKEMEESLNFTPVFDEKGLIPCITTSAKTGKVLMFAYMNEESLRRSIETGEAHYWSRSRNALWHKGATSGLTQKIISMRTDCDQDCIWIAVEAPAPAPEKEASCHTGRESCFYREIPCTSKNANDPKMTLIDAKMIFDPKDVYKN